MVTSDQTFEVSETSKVSQSWQDLSVLIAGCGSIGKRHARVLSGMGVQGSPGMRSDP